MRVEDIDIAYDDEGDGIPVVLVHGHPFNRSMWRPQVERLRSRYRVIAPDLRGFGETPVRSGSLPWTAFADDLIGLLDRLGLERVVLCGLSMGGQVVMEVHRAHPSRVRALVLADTFPEGETVAGRELRHGMAARVLREGMGGYADEVLDKMLSPRNVVALPAVAEHVLGMMRGTSPVGAAVAWRARAERPDYVDSLSRATVPVLVVVGEEDEYTPVAVAERMHAAIPGSALAVIPGAGHLPNLERPDAFSDAVERFLAGV
ncbi:pimeloyl-ACP methyl ester carboxylesterase [Saccharothrix saharensis]|uniref:Pimeloyl-ACP methyl ester carboxylesterase n=1 Tax=Saccharothrix saharensis TaxID=571190 RepID=A0A543J8E3_9PSEU|nr:alpha/beta fold hydrolase [Saccharothrix saharensis]TQM79087.1 pimeloyl-ACP methyl ester carboxylesterase [Saccharothrix saharensis]